ncbi:hypothetical protein C5167_027618 [Papaver somniferum]|nr:hypothetical protein C5167_027618 [Papaver somniferum]
MATTSLSAFLTLTGPEFPSCNLKIIGAQAFYKGLEAELGHRVDVDGKDSRSPRDTSGHGTHCAATEGGSSVKNAGFHNYSVGEAKGIATRARIASYKVLWKSGGVSSDILAGINQSVQDRVDVMSISIGYSNGDVFLYDQDLMAIATFGAIEKGILVSLSAGNDGQKGPKVIGNVAPWMLTVGGSTIDREFRGDVILGDGQVFPVCLSSSSVPKDTASVVNAAGGVAMIYVTSIDQFEALPSNSYQFPATDVTVSSGLKIINYITSNLSEDKKPTAKINFRGTVTGSSSSSAPRVYVTSSTGKYIAAISVAANAKFSTPFQQGSGHVDPNKALNPGLVYDIAPSDYEAFLCTIGYSETQMKLFVKDRTVDCDSVKLSSVGDLNYSSFSVVFESGKTQKIKYKRVVTNVGASADAIYKLRFRSGTPHVKISVSPTKFVFSKGVTSLAYEITFESRPTDLKEAFGSIEWYDGEHVVWSPIAFVWDPWRHSGLQQIASL